MDTKKILANRIKELRKEKGITQKDLAQITGLGYSSIVCYENGLREPNSKAMVALEKYFNVSGEFLRGEVDKPTFIQNSENINDELDQVIIQVQAFKNKYLISNQDKQALAANVLSQIIKLITDNLLNNNIASNISVLDIIGPFSAVFNLNDAGVEELNKRADELQQLKQYKK